MRRSTLLVMAATAGFAAAPASAATTVFADGNFAPGSFTPAFLQLSNPGNTFVASQCTTCGVGGSSAEQILVSFVDTSSNVNNMIGLLNGSFVYNPATSGAITSIDVSTNKNFTVTTGQLYNNAFRTLIAQNGSFYEAPAFGTPLQGPGTTGFTTISATGLTAASFSRVNIVDGSFDANSHPDFAGGAMTFGFAQLLGTSGVAGPQATIVYDDVRFAIASVPEPSSWALLIAGFGGIGGVMRRRRGGGMPAIA